MKQFLLAWTAVLGLTAAGLPARATPIDFTYTGSVVDFTVPATGTYQIVAFGAQGGNAACPAFGCVSSGFVGLGGLGAEIGGDFILASGEVLQIAVGGAGIGSGATAGGGGGSFVVGPGNTPLVIAGGGGAGGLILDPMSLMYVAGEPGGGGLTGPDGGGADPSSPPPNGTNGNGGPPGFETSFYRSTAVVVAGF